MFDDCDSIGKATSIAHYLAKTSTFAPNKVISFGSNPRLVDITTGDITGNTREFHYNEFYNRLGNDLEYSNEIKRMYRGYDGNSTDFAKVMNLIKNLQTDYPEYIVVLSDMEFNCGGSKSASDLTNEWRKRGIKTKIIWWNFNAHAKTVPQAIKSDENGNIFISGYNPLLLQYLESGFDGESFIMKLLYEYAKHLPDNLNL